MPEFPLQQLISQYPRWTVFICGSFALFFFAILLTVWLLFGMGPRRRRGMRAARKLLKAGFWKPALDELKRVRAIGAPSKSWVKHFDVFEADCMEAAAAAALKERKFEDALKHGIRAAQILDQPEHEVRMKVQAAMLREIRRLFSKHGETQAVIDLVARTMLIQSPCREASFWLALCELRNGSMESALANLQVARTGESRSFGLDEFADMPERATPPAPPSPFIDPPLYLGAVLLRMGQAKESLRFLTEANRMDANCPFITLQLGAAIVTAGGDTNMAVRALQRALGTKGFGMWQDDPQRAWVEGLPDNRSYIRKLAAEFPFVCPVFGEDLKYLIRQGNLALAQGLFKVGNFQESADLFDKVLKEGAPSLPVLRGLGLSLAKLGRYDDAFVHLRTAHEMEEVKERLTAGYLALCGAAGKPARPEDKLQNTAWAIRLVTQFNAPGDLEWIGILNRIFAEARQHGIQLGSDDQLYLCEHLVSVHSSEPLSAQAFHHLVATAPALVHPEYAWLYCRADQQHDVGGDWALDLYTRTFANPELARAFFAERGWDFDEVELMFLRRAAEKAPGRFPEVLGPEYPLRGEQRLLAKSQQLEDAGQREKALGFIEVLVRLSPNNISAMDRAAGLHYRAGRLQPACDLLEQWQRTRPDDPLPFVREAILLHLQGNPAACTERLRHAMSICNGRRRANCAFLGARLALQGYLLSAAEQAANPAGLETVQSFLHECLVDDPTHPQALWCVAAVRWLQGDTENLARQASAMQNAEVADPRYHYVAALCHLLGNQYEGAVAAAERAGRQAGLHRGRNGDGVPLNLAAEAGYLAALAQIGLQQPDAAIDALKPITRTPGSPTMNHAQGLLGNVLFQQNRHDEALQAWQALDANQRQAWGLADPLAQTTFISALESMRRAEYEQAAEKLRQAGKLGYRDRRLGPLLLLALFKAGQQAIYAGETAAVVSQEAGVG